MSTARQRAANKLNAQKSTGPITPEGKAISSRNRVSAGFNTSVAYFNDFEKEADFWQLLDDFTTQYQPANPTEQVLVERMVHNQWNALRAFRLQSGQLFCMNGISDPVPHDLGLLSRYQNAAERAFDKAHAELVKARKEREKSEIGFVSQTAASAPPADPETPAETTQNTPDEPPPVPELVYTPEIVTAIQELTLDFTPEPVPDSENVSQAA